MTLDSVNRTAGHSAAFRSKAFPSPHAAVGCRQHGLPLLQQMAHFANGWQLVSLKHSVSAARAQVEPTA
jgi:hypothetical protein